jgi:hypothetical protein
MYGKRDGFECARESLVLSMSYERPALGENVENDNSQIEFE